MRVSLAAVLLVSCSLLIACGSSSKTTSSNTPNASPAPTSSSPSPTPSPTPTPTPSAAPTTYLTTMGCTTTINSACNTEGAKGTIVIDEKANDGHGIVNFDLGAQGANATFTVKFCPASGNGQNCFDNGTVTADANGGGSSPFTFAKHGTFSGGWFLTQNGQNILNTGADPHVSGVSFSTALLPPKPITGSGSGGPGSGTAVESNGTMTFTLTGALPNHTYEAGGCSGTVCKGSTLMTDANGNGKVAVGQMQMAPAFLGFGISDSSGIAFLEGFVVQ